MSSFTKFALITSMVGIASVGVPSLHAQSADNETILIVRVVSHDAKIIGSNVGGARIVIQDASTGEVLAEGIQEGSTGSTDRIMSMPAYRDSTRYDTDGAAAFEASLNISEPTQVVITAYGPLGTPHAIQQSSKTMLVLPGKHVTGEGILLELNGFTVELLEATAMTQRVKVTARVTMLCGCPTAPGGMWNSNDITVEARLESNGRVFARQRLSYAGKTSEYTSTIEAPPGLYDLVVTAADASKGNFGMVRGTALIP